MVQDHYHVREVLLVKVEQHQELHDHQWQWFLLLLLMLQAEQMLMKDRVMVLIGLNHQHQWFLLLHLMQQAESRRSWRKEQWFQYGLSALLWWSEAVGCWHRGILTSHWAQEHVKQHELQEKLVTLISATTPDQFVKWWWHYYTQWTRKWRDAITAQNSWCTRQYSAQKQ